MFFLATALALGAYLQQLLHMNRIWTQFFVEKLQLSLKATIPCIVEESPKTLKQEITNEPRAKREYFEKMNNLKALSDAVLVEPYSRREKLGTFVLPEETAQSHDGKTLSES